MLRYLSNIKLCTEIIDVLQLHCSARSRSYSTNKTTNVYSLSNLQKNVLYATESVWCLFNFRKSKVAQQRKLKMSPLLLKRNSRVKWRHFYWYMWGNNLNWQICYWVIAIIVSMLRNIVPPGLDMNTHQMWVEFGSGV